MLHQRQEPPSNSAFHKPPAIVNCLLSVATCLLPLATFLPPLEAENLPVAKPVSPSPTVPQSGQGVPQTCDNAQASYLPLSNIESFWGQVATSVDRPTRGLEVLLNNWGPKLMASLTPSPFPEINDRAKAAKVPVMMYHDIVPKKEVFFDVTPQELESHFQLIKSQNMTPISLEQLVTHLRTGVPLPEKPIVLTFDDGYGGHYEYVYPLLKKYGYPAVFSIYTSGVGKNTGRSHVTWDQLRQMAADPLVTIASHSISHPHDLTTFTDDQLFQEVMRSKRILEKQLGMPIQYFTYPEGKSDARVRQWVVAAGYRAAVSMDDAHEQFAADSGNLLTIGRFGQSRLQDITAQAWGGSQLPSWGGTGGGFDFTSPVKLSKATINQTRVILISGGRPATIHAKSRYQVQEILQGTDAVAAVDGGFFSMKTLDSNIMVGPVLSQADQRFIAGNKGETPLLNGRPLVLISPQAVKFIPFNSSKHNTEQGIRHEMQSVTDAFVAAAWLVKDGQSQPASSFGSLFDYDAARHRAFWGVNQSGQPVIGVSTEPIDSVSLGVLLQQAGLRDAVMLDSGASTSLVYQKESLVGYTPRPVPHVVALFAPNSSCVNNQLISAKE